MSEDKGDGAAMRVDSDLIRQLADLLTEKDLSEIEVEDGDRKIVVKRMTTAAFTQALGQAAAAQGRPAAPAAPPTAAAAPAPEAAAEAAPPADAVKSPMVGTVFLSPEPGAAAFVSAGSKIKEGDTLLIIEAMKVMNPIAAPKAGVVRQVLVQDNQPVEYDQPLVVLD